MEFDPKCFFDNPPRMKEDLKDYIKDLANKIVFKISKFSHTLFPGERLNHKHIKFVVMSMSIDPITSFNRQGLCILNSRLKPYHKILTKAIDETILAFEQNEKNGNLDRKIVKSCSKVLEKIDFIKTTTTGILAIASIVCSICGLLLQSSKAGDSKTLSIETLRQYGTNHLSSNGNSYPYSSFIRFLYIIDNFEPLALTEPPKTETKTETKNMEICDYTKSKKQTKKRKSSHEKEEHHNTKSSVQFLEQKKRERIRPSTPENCFWEE